MEAVVLASILVETLVERLKELGLKNYSAWLSLVTACLLAVAMKVQILPQGMISQPIANYLISGFIISGGSNYVNSVRDTLKK